MIPVDYYIPGCPPRPEAILYAIAYALGLVPKQVAAPTWRGKRWAAWRRVGKRRKEVEHE